MKPFFVWEIKDLLNGELIQGSDDQQILDATSYIQLMTKKNMLLFLTMKWKIDWDALSKCVPVIIVTDKIYEQFAEIKDCTVIKVENIDTAFWTFVNYYRDSFDIPVIAVTGTSGKTTTKDMIRHILSGSLKVQGTEFSANGRTGHFSYLLRLDDSVQAAVFETAVGGPGDISYSCKFFKPIIGIITNIGVDHLDECKTEEAYFEAKAEMINQIPNNGILILNHDDPKSSKLNLEKFKGRVIYIGINRSSQFQASDIQYTKNGITFILTYLKIKYHVFVAGVGVHQVYNALAALAASHELGIGINEGINRLQTFKNLPFHLQIKKGIRNSTILDDTWNINLTSMGAALEALIGIGDNMKKVVLLGNFLGLGDKADEIHYRLGKLIAEAGNIDVLVVVGNLADKVSTGAKDGGFTGEIYAFSSTDGVSDVLENILDEKTIVLAKCSMFDYEFKELLQGVIVE